MIAHFLIKRFNFYYNNLVLKVVILNMTDILLKY